MHEQTLVSGAADSLEILGKSGLLDDAYLAGGTGTALQLGHRISVDFDFFTNNEFKPSDFASELSRTGDFEAEQTNRGTVTGRFNGIRFSLFNYEHPLLFPCLEHRCAGIADLRDIAAMKIDAIASRGAKRDFVDLYFICESGFSLAEILGFYDKKYGKLSANRIHILKSLVYFKDAEQDEMPQMLKQVSWDNIKTFLENNVKKLS